MAGKIRCTCGNYHKTQRQRAACLKKQGKLGKKQVKESTDAADMDIRQSSSLKIQAANVQVEGDIPIQPNKNIEKISVQAQPQKNVEIISNFDQTRHGYKRKTVSCQILKNMHFARQMNKQDESQLNILEQIMQEEYFFDNNSNYQLTKNKLGKRPFFRKLNSIKQRQDHIFRIIEEVYIKDSLQAQLSCGIWAYKDVIAIRKQIASKCQKEIQQYRSNYQKIGKISKYNARFQPFQQILEKDAWKDFEQKRQKLQQILQKRELNEDERQQWQKRDKIFLRFKEQAFKKEIELRLFVYQKIIHKNQNGQIVSFQRRKIGAIHKFNTEYLVKQFEKKVIGRFQLLCSYFRFKIMAQKVVKADLQNYPEMCAQIDLFYKEKKLNMELKSIILQQQNAERIRLLRQQLQNQSNQKKQLKSIPVRLIRPQNWENPEMSQWFKGERIIKSEKDFHQLLLCIMYQKKIDITKQIQQSSIHYKLTQIQPCSITLAPYGFIAKKRSYSLLVKKYIYFQNHTEIQQILSKYLMKCWACYQQQIKGFFIKALPSLFQYRQTKNNSCSISVCTSTQTWFQQKPNNLQSNEDSFFTFTRKISDPRKQEEYLKLYPKHQPPMLQIDTTLQFLYWRNKISITISQLLSHSLRDKKMIKMFVNAFSNFYSFNQQGYIKCQVFNSSKRLQQFQQAKQKILNKKIYTSQDIMDKNQKNIILINQPNFNQTSYQVSSKAQKLKAWLQKYRFSSLSKTQVKKKLNPLNKSCYQLINLMKDCSICKKAFTRSDFKRKVCRICYNQMHMECSLMIYNCYCQNLEFPICRLQNQPDIMKIYCQIQINTHSFLKREVFQGITTFKPQTSRQIIQEEQKTIILALQARDHFQYSYSAMIHSNIAKTIEIDRFWDPLLIDADKQLTLQWKKYSKGQFKAPVQLKIMHQNFFGIQTLEPIPKLTLICQYAADIVPMIYSSKFKWKDHIMLYSQGRISQQELVIVPFNFCNWGPLINYSHNPNCSFLRIVIENKIRVLIYTLKDIPEKTELFINYNGYHDQYSVENFEELGVV